MRYMFQIYVWPFKWKLLSSIFMSIANSSCFSLAWEWQVSNEYNRTSTGHLQTYILVKHHLLKLFLTWQVKAFQKFIFTFYYMEESVLLGTKPLVDSIHHFIWDPSGVFSVCHLCECRIVQWRHDSRLLLLLNWFLHIIKRTLHVGSKIWILCSRGKNNISLVRCTHSWDIVLATRT